VLGAGCGAAQLCDASLLAAGACWQIAPCRDIEGVAGAIEKGWQSFDNRFQISLHFSPQGTINGSG
jgi:hypothetical protein